MPNYDWECTSCGSVTERVVAMELRDRKQYCRRLDTATGCFCAGLLKRQFPMPRAFLTVIESPSMKKRLKAEGKMCVGDAKLHEMERHWDRQEKEADERLDRQAKKWAEDCVTTLGESGLYTQENQQRGDTVPLPEEIRGKI